MKTSPAAVIAAPKLSDPVTSKPVEIMASAQISPVATIAPAVKTRAAVNGAKRPMTPAPTSSARPDSSSPRVWRTMVRIAIRARTV
ncbi:hypothetical protein GCM10020219_086540 [Nonomuraea dietziae]